MNRVKKIQKCTKLGTNYGGWIIPSNIDLDENSIIYSGGVGEDISFDLILSDKYDSNIILIDPTKRSLVHFEEIQKFYKKDLDFSKLSGDIQKDYHNTINNLNPNFEKFKYLDIGLWDKSEELKFFKPSNPKYISHSLINGMTSNNYDIVKVNSIKNIMEKNNHMRIDLLKLDIEGAEIETINQMLDDDILPTYLLVEFDLILKKKDKHNKTKKLLNRLKNHYDIIVNDNYNITFKRKELNFIGRSDGLGNRIEELINLEAFSIKNNIKINYFWNNNTGRSDRRYKNLLDCKNIKITNKSIRKNLEFVREKDQQLILKAGKNIRFINEPEIKEDYISIHIRGGDKLISSITSKDDKSYMSEKTLYTIIDHYVKLIKEEEIKRIFVCTDEIKYKNYFLSKLGDGFNFMNEKYFDDEVYNDLFLLTRSKKIFMCSKFSSFSIVASILGNIPLVSCYKQEETLLHRYNAIVELKLI